MINLREYREILNKIKEVYNYDYGDYALSILRNRINDTIRILNYSEVKDFLQDIEKDEKLFNYFSKEIAVDETEMFRDPSVWRILKSEVLPKLVGSNTAKIWFPDVSSGDDIYSMAILLKETGLTDKFAIYASSHCSLCIEDIEKGVYDIKKKEVNIANYERFKGEAQLSDYFRILNKKIHMNYGLLENVSFINKSMMEKSPSGIKLIMFRNRMLYYNGSLKNKFLKLINEKLISGGYLCVGIKELIDDISERYISPYEDEAIFKKI